MAADQTITGRSQRLRAIDIRRIFYLIGEITELGREPARWRTHLLTHLLPMIHARLGIVGEAYINPTNPLETKIVGMVEIGWAPGEQEMFYSHLSAGGMVQDPLHAVVPKLVFRSFTRRRRDFISDEVWYASPITDPLRRQCNVDDTIHSRCRLPQPGWAQFMSLMRPWGGEPFSIRDRWIVSLLHRELGRLWKAVDTGQLAILSPRLRQTLDLIFSGYNEREMSEVLNLSTHTVHDFARRLYRHFAVSSRGELLANPSCRQLLLRPALSPAYFAHDRGIADTFETPLSNQTGKVPSPGKNA